MSIIKKENKQKKGRTEYYNNIPVQFFYCEELNEWGFTSESLGVLVNRDRVYINKIINRNKRAIEPYLREVTLVSSDNRPRNHTFLKNTIPNIPMFLNRDVNLSYWVEIGTENRFYDFYDLEQYCKELKESTSFTFFPVVRYPDILIPSRKLCIEVDGKSHESKEQKDINRDELFRKAGIRTLRFRNNELNSEKKLRIVVEKVKGVLYNWK